MNPPLHKWADAPARTRQPTQRDVLLVLSDLRRLFWYGDRASECDDWIIDENDSLDILLFELMIDDSAEEAGESLKLIFGPQTPVAEIEPMLRKPGKHTVGELCRILAEHLSMEAVEPAKIMGQQSWEAAVFRIFRRALIKDAGADVAQLKPSSQLEPYLKEHGKPLLLLASRLAPGALPESPGAVDRPITTLANRAGCWLCAGGMLCAFLGWLLFRKTSAPPHLLLIMLGVAAVLTSYGLAWLSSRIRPRSYRWGEMTTFGDLACAIAGHLRAQARSHDAA